MATALKGQHVGICTSGSEVSVGQDTIQTGATHIGAGTFGSSETSFCRSSLYCSPLGGRSSMSMTVALIVEVECQGNGGTSLVCVKAN